MMEDIEIRSYQTGDEFQIIKLHNEVFAQNRTLDHWNWQYKAVPAGPPIIKVLCKGTEIIGHFSLIPYSTYYKRTRIISGKAEGAMIATKYRFISAKNQLFERMVEAATADAFSRDINLLWGLTNAIKSFENVGFTHIGAVKSLSREEKHVVLFRLLKNTLKRSETCNSKHLLKYLTYKQNPSTLKKLDSGKITSNVREFMSEDLNRTFIFPPLDNKVSLVRDEKFLHWRFHKNPFTKAHVSVIIHNDELLGYIAYSQKNGVARSRGYIVDYCTKALDDNLVDAMLHSSIQILRLRGSKVISVLQNDRMNPELLTKHGLIFKSDMLGIIVRCNPAVIDNSFISDPRNWALSMAFTEGRFG